MNAEQVLDIIKNQMETDEKWKLLDELYHEFYDKRNLPKVEFADD